MVNVNSQRPLSGEKLLTQLEATPGVKAGDTESKEKIEMRIGDEKYKVEKIEANGGSTTITVDREIKATEGKKYIIQLPWYRRAWRAFMRWFITDDPWEKAENDQK